jgi:citrate lyase subunit beta/citryl-CoA lyase
MLVPAEISRSWLLVNGLHQDRFTPAATSRADQVILDIEDAVDPKFKGEARDMVVKWLSAGNEAWVRINDYTTDFWREDVDVLRNAKGLKGVVLAKTEASNQVTETFDMIGRETPVIALVESALGIEDARQIASARGAFRLAFGSGDYRRDT